MEDVKRWSVTYTKHIKQKRKVYQDGLLELHSLNNKVILYDDSETPLDSRFLKKDEFIKSGETLVFDSYLIDIGDSEEDHKPLLELNFQGKDKRANGKVGLISRTRLADSSFCIESRKTNVVKKKAFSSYPSISHKIIGEFKKSELHKYGAPQIYPDTTKSSITEWQALYTTQITQKAKKYHDGFLQISICGSRGRQAMLYDASRKLLDSRFLKKGEVIEFGQSLAFDAHLVDIGKPDQNYDSLVHSNVQQNNCTKVGQTRMPHGRQNIFEDNKTTLQEWHALYTTQITQKIKKYQSGILKLASCGSQQMQVTLLNEDGATLSSKYLELMENVRTGSTFELQRYLVEVGEPRTNPEGEPQSEPCPGKYVDLNSSSTSVDRIKLSRRIPMSMPIRDAHQILSILKKPMVRANTATAAKADMEQHHTAQSIDLIDFDLNDEGQEQLTQESKKFNQSAVEYYEDDSKTLDERVGTMQSSESVFAVSEAGFNNFSCDIIKLEKPESIEEMPLYHSVSSTFSLVSRASNILSPKLEIGCTGEDAIISSSFTGKLQHNESIETDTRWSEGTFASGISSSKTCASHDLSKVERKISEHNNAQETDECPSFDLGF